MLLTLYQKIRIYLYRFNSSCKDLLILGKINQPTLFIGDGKISIKPSSSIGTRTSPGFLLSSYIEAREKSAQIKIGAHTHINNNATLIAEKSEIIIGDNVLIGFDFCAMDSDFHNISPKIRNQNTHICKPIHIKNNVFIGSKVTILKGVTIGENSVIAAGALVVKSVPASEIWGGVPAQKISAID